MYVDEENRPVRRLEALIHGYYTALSVHGIVESVPAMTNHFSTWLRRHHRVVAIARLGRCHRRERGEWRCARGLLFVRGCSLSPRSRGRFDCHPWRAPTTHGKARQDWSRRANRSSGRRRRGSVSTRADPLSPFPLRHRSSPTSTRSTRPQDQTRPRWPMHRHGWRMSFRWRDTSGNRL